MWSFTSSVVSGAPAERGVYALFDGPELIYIGRADGLGVTIRSRLQSHLRGDEGRCTQQATQYTWEVCPAPSLREAELLAEYRAQTGSLPRCNQRVG